MLIKSILIENVLSIKNCFIEFPDSGLVLVDGWNYDDDSANGSGKTSIFNALSLALYGKLPRKITNSKIARKGSKGFKVVCAVNIGDSTLIIERTKPKDFSVTFDDKQVIWNQDQLDQFLGLNYSQFLLTTYRSQTEGANFLSLNDADKKDLFLTLIDLNKFDSAKESIDNNIKQLSKTIDDIKSKILSAKSKIEAYQDSLIDVSSLKQELNSLDPSNLQDKIKQLSQIQEPNLSSNKSLLDDLKLKLKDLAQQEREELSDRHKLDTLRDSLSSIEETINSKLTSVECPHCSNHFAIASGRTLKQQQIESLVNKKKEDINANISSLISKINSYPNFKQEVKATEDLILKTNLEYSTSREAFMSAKMELSELKSKISILESRRQSITESIARDSENREKIVALKQALEKLYLSLESKTNNVSYLEAISSILAPTGAPAYILDSIVELFNQMVSDILIDVWPNASYHLLTYKESKTGDTKSKMSERLTVGGVEVDVGSLSGGELACLSLATSLGLILTFESSTGNKINHVILDEQFENMDYANKERCLSVLQRYSTDRCFIIVDHSSEAKSSFNKILKIEKRNGISSVL